MIELEDVFTEKYKGLEWTLDGNISTEEEFNLKFSVIRANGVTEPTWAKIQEYKTAMQAEYDVLDYSRKRKAAYDELNQYELMYDDKVNSTDKWGEAIAAIKTKFPKG